jgi:hypothetical protein
MPSALPVWNDTQHIFCMSARSYASAGHRTAVERTSDMNRSMRLRHTTDMHVPDIRMWLLSRHCGTVSRHHSMQV